MIEAGLHRITDRLEEIGSAAGKEFALETAMDKMKQVGTAWVRKTWKAEIVCKKRVFVQGLIL
jgi:hypothetical protein